MVLGKSFLYIMFGFWMIGEKSENLIICGQTESAKKCSYGEFSLPINAHVHGAVRVSLNLYPSSTTRDDLGAKSGFTLQFL